MKLKLSLDVLTESMTMVSEIVADKHLQEDMKNLIVYIKDGQVYFTAYNGDISSAIKVDAEYELEEGQSEAFIQLKARDINEVINALKGLTKTKVDKVMFDIQENEAIFHIYEEPVDPDEPNAQKYYQEGKYRVTKPRLKTITRQEIEKINMNPEGVNLPSIDVALYLDSLYPTVQAEKREATNSVLFSDDHIYTMPSSYSAIMPNKLPEVFRGFRLKNTTLKFLKNFIAMDEAFTIHKEETSSGMVILTVKVGDAVSVIKCANMARAFDLTNYLETPANGVVINKQYFKSVLKRMSLSSEPTTIKISIENGVGTMTALSKSMKQELPVVASKGEGEFSFSIRADMLSNLIFSHIDMGENVFLYLEKTDANKIALSVKDNTEAWQTKVLSLSPVSSDFAWA